MVVYKIMNGMGDIKYYLAPKITEEEWNDYQIHDHICIAFTIFVFKLISNKIIIFSNNIYFQTDNFVFYFVISYFLKMI